MFKTISSFYAKIQACLPGFVEESTTMTMNHQKIMYALDQIRIENMFPNDGSHYGKGRPQAERAPIARAFIAKSILNISQTKALIDRIKVDPVLRRICGWNFEREIPCEATFSNAFKEFAENKIVQELHAQMVIDAHIDVPIHHISRDSTEIDAREKPIKKSEVKKDSPNETNPKINISKPGRGRPKKGEVREVKLPPRIELQTTQTLSEMLADIPTHCDTGTKKNSKGYKVSWNGYKLHADVADGGVVVACILTSASVHDSQLAIPLEVMSNALVRSYYTLADAAYDAKSIHEFISGCGKVALIDENPRRGEKSEVAPPQRERYKNRTSVERFFSDLKDNYGASRIMVKGSLKVMCHLMFGVLSHTAIQLGRLS